MASVSYEDGLLEMLKEDAEFASAYLNEALQDGSQEVFLLALRDVAMAKGMAKTARETELNRESMYRMLSPKGNPNFSSLSRLLSSLGLALSISVKEKVA